MFVLSLFLKTGNSYCSLILSTIVSYLISYFLVECACVLEDYQVLLWKILCCFLYVGIHIALAYEMETGEHDRKNCLWGSCMWLLLHFLSTYWYIYENGTLWTLCTVVCWIIFGTNCTYALQISGECLIDELLLYDIADSIVLPIFSRFGGLR